MDCIVHGVTKSQIQLSDFHFDENLNVFTWTFSNGATASQGERLPAVILKYESMLIMGERLVTCHVWLPRVCAVV